MTTTSQLTAVVLAGGSGTRLWPFSRQQFPKQLMSLDGNLSMLSSTIQRLSPLVERKDTWVVTGAELATGAGYRELQDLHYMVEPSARNTAPAIGVMAAYLNDFGNDPIMLVLAADHVITDVPAFHTAIQTAVQAAQTGKIVTFGITANRPETGYGYIKATQPAEATGCLLVERFVEKPNLAKAESYLAEGDFYWNSGMFVARASTMLDEFKTLAPSMYAGIEAIRKAWATNGGDWRTAINENFNRIPADSFDYAIMEKSRNVVLIPCNIGWSDVGSWDAVYDLAEKSAEGNSIQSPNVAIDTSNTLVMGHSNRMIATIGISDLCIIDTPDALLVTHRSQAQKVKNVVDELKKQNGEAHIVHRTAYRPWGSYTVLEDANSGYKIKRIDVIPGGRLSLQSHKHRSEHWVVVAGTATVTNGDTVSTLTTGQSTYIPLGHKHRLENQGETPVQIVEVQVGSYLGEDDITRYDDVYGRE